MSLFHHILPYLSDSVLMNELPDNLLVNALFPVLQIVTSRSTSFLGGWRPRSLLLFKLLDVVYLVGLRIGEEMARSHLTPLCSAFFSSFDKVIYTGTNCLCQGSWVVADASPALN